MRFTMAMGAVIATALTGVFVVLPAIQTPSVRRLDEASLREYAGVYQWAPDAFLYLQLWNELSGTNELVAFDESGAIRTLYSTDRDRFFAGPGAAVATRVESWVEFQRESSGQIASLTWRRDGAPLRTARRVAIEKREDVRFANGDIQLAGTLISPTTEVRHPVVILVHASGPVNRDYMLPFARFLIRHGMAVFGYDKRGVGGSAGNWSTASFEDLAGDVVAAFDYLKTRRDIDPTQIGMLGWSQAGWIMPLAAVRAKDMAFLVSVSGAGVPCCRNHDRSGPERDDGQRHGATDSCRHH